MNNEYNYIDIAYANNNKYYIKNDETKILRNIINENANNKYYHCWTTDSETDEMMPCVYEYDNTIANDDKYEYFM